MATPTKKQIWIGVGITALVVAVILVVANWTKLSAWAKSLGTPKVNGNGNGNGNGTGTGRFGGVNTGTGTTAGNRSAYINQIRTLYKTASGTDLTSVELARLNTASLAELKVLLTQATSRAPKWYCCNIFTAKCCIENPYPGGSGV